MPKRLSTVLFATDKDALERMCRESNLNSYETEIILRIYWKRQSLNFIADTMDFRKHGKDQQYYSVRSINSFHKEAFMKLIIK